MGWPCGDDEQCWFAKRVCVGECAGSRSVGRLRKRWIYTMKDWLRKRGLDFMRISDFGFRRMVQDRIEWRGFMRRNAWDVARGMNPRHWWDATVVGCHSYMKPLDGGPVRGRVYNLKGIKEKISFFSFLSFASLLLLLISWHDACSLHGGGRR